MEDSKNQRSNQNASGNQLTTSFGNGDSYPSNQSLGDTVPAMPSQVEYSKFSLEEFHLPQLLPLIHERFSSLASTQETINLSQAIGLLQTITQNKSEQLNQESLTLYERLIHSVYIDEINEPVFISSLLDFAQLLSIVNSLNDQITKYSGLLQEVPQQFRSSVAAIQVTAHKQLSRVLNDLPHFSKTNPSQQSAGLARIFAHYSRKKFGGMGQTEQWTMQLFLEFMRDFKLSASPADTKTGKSMQLTSQELSLIYKKSCPNNMSFDEFSGALDMVADVLYGSGKLGPAADLRNTEERRGQLLAFLQPEKFRGAAPAPTQARPAQRQRRMSAKKLNKSVEGQIQRWKAKQKQAVEITQRERGSVSPQRPPVPKHIAQRLQQRESQLNSKSALNWEALTRMSATELSTDISNVIGGISSDEDDPQTQTPMPIIHPLETSGTRLPPISFRARAYPSATQVPAYSHRAIDETLDTRYNEVMKNQRHRYHRPPNATTNKYMV